jgi:hypothetical protein
MWFFGIFNFFWYQWTSLYERKCESTEGFEWRMMGAYGEREVFKELFCEASAPAKSSFARQPPALSCEPFSLTIVTSLPIVCSLSNPPSLPYQSFVAGCGSCLSACFPFGLPLSIHACLLGWLSLCYCIVRQFTLDQSINLAYFIHPTTR